MTKPDPLGTAAIDNLGEDLRNHPHHVFCARSGSRASGNAHERSDRDIARVSRRLEKRHHIACRSAPTDQ